MLRELHGQFFRQRDREKDLYQKLFVNKTQTEEKEEEKNGQHENERRKKRTTKKKTQANRSRVQQPAWAHRHTTASTHASA